MSEQLSGPGSRHSVATPVGSPLLHGRVNSIPEVLDRLEAIQNFAEATQALGKHDGVACFNYLYHVITGRVQENVGTGFFQDDEFLTRLDVAFANRYLDALRGDAKKAGNVPRPWKVLFEKRSDDGVTPLQFAVAGVNAHINFDLACAVVDACEELGREPDSGAQEDAYERVNDIFAQEMERLRQHFEDRLQLWVDENVLCHVDDIIGNWSVQAARAHAWKLAELLWRLRTVDVAEDFVLQVQDRTVGALGHFILQRVA